MDVPFLFFSNTLTASWSISSETRLTFPQSDDSLPCHVTFLPWYTIHVAATSSAELRQTDSLQEVYLESLSGELSEQKNDAVKRRAG